MVEALSAPSTEVIDIGYQSRQLFADNLGGIDHSIFCDDRSLGFDLDCVVSRQNFSLCGTVVDSHGVKRSVESIWVVKMLQKIFLPGMIGSFMGHLR